MGKIHHLNSKCGRDFDLPILQFMSVCGAVTMLSTIQGIEILFYSQITVCTDQRRLAYQNLNPISTEKLYLVTFKFFWINE